MSSISVVVVTGASGFIGAHIVRECLERGYTVNACVRNKDDPKNAFLLNMAKNIGRGRIVLFSANLLAADAYDEAVSNADAVIHAAAQVDPGVIKDPWKDMVEPSTEGARNILRSVNKFNIRHYVHTSSMAAVGMARGRPCNEGDWATASIEQDPYQFAKTEAEKVVWRETEGKPYKVTCINPSMVFGPCLAKPHTKASPFVFRQALFGNRQPNLPYMVVDVREVAFAHVEALACPQADRKRFILDGDEPSIAVNDLIQKCREMFPQYLFTDAPGPKHPQGFDEQIYRRSVTDNTRSKTVLGVKYRPMEESIRDSIESIVGNNFVPPRAAAKL